MGKQSKPYQSGVALFLNSTLTSYHWGCYATSAMIHRRLEEAGYLVNSFPVEVTHGALPAVAMDRPPQLEVYDQALKDQNLALYVAIIDADIVVVNGEGTIHRDAPGPTALLALIAYLSYLGKPVHLINHSCFPNGDRLPASPLIEQYYKACLSGLDTVAVREPWSAQVYARLGVAATESFDCLPLYMKTYVEAEVVPQDQILVSILNAASDEEAQAVGWCVQQARGDRRVSFLGGGYKRAPFEDDRHFAALASQIEGLEFLAPPTIDAWVSTIASARLLVTGRYHHFIAGLCVGAQMVLMPGNTPKIEAVADWIGHPLHRLDDPALSDIIAEALANPPADRRPRLDELAGLAARNFEFLKTP